MDIPSRYRGTCEFCNQPLDTRTEGVHQWTSGWVMVREGGGGHGISLPERANRWCHRYCLERVIKGWDKQESLFPA